MVSTRLINSKVDILQMNKFPSIEIPPKLVAFGNVLLDFAYRIEKNPVIVFEYGFEPNGLGECSSETLSSVRTVADKTCEFLSSQTGGSALNTSKILSLLGETRNVFCGAIGNDSNGLVVKQQLEMAGLKTRLQIVEGQPTGSCVCLINKGNRCCYANIGASSHFRQEFLITQDFVEHSEHHSTQNQRQIFYIEGFFITDDRFPVCKYISDELCIPTSESRILAINLSAKYIAESHSESMKHLAEHATILFGNNDEFSKLAEIYNKSNVKDLIAHLMDDKTIKTSDKVIICTRGSDSVIYSSKSENVLNEEFRFEAVPKHKIIDTTGCGDAFVAGFFYAFIRNESVERCVSKGVEVASKKLSSVGGNL